MRLRIAVALAAVLTLSLTAQPAQHHQVARVREVAKWSAAPSIEANRAPPRFRRSKARPKPRRATHRLAPIPSHPSAPSYTPPSYSGSVPDLIRSIFPESQWSMALCVANRESGFYPGAKNPTSSASGVFQMVAIWWDGYWHFDPFDAVENVTHAEMLWEMSGWAPWGGSCS